MTNSHQYAFDAARLLLDCIQHLQEVVDLDASNNHDVLYELKEELLRSERMLQEYFLQLVKSESTEDTKDILSEKLQGNEQESDNLPPLSASIEALKSILQRSQASERPASPRRRRRIRKSPSTRQHGHNPTMYKAVDISNPQSQLHQAYSSSRNATDSLLFRLIVALQLCLVRIDDALFVIGGHRRNSGNRLTGKTPQGRRVRSWMVTMGYCGGILGATAYLIRRDRREGAETSPNAMVFTLAKVGASAFLVGGMAKQWKALWMASKIEKTIAEIEEWQQQWLLVNYDTKGDSREYSISSAQTSNNDALDAAKSKLLIEYALRENSHKSSSFWLSQGELRFLMVRKALDVFYALQPSNWHLQATAAAEASFHSLTGTEDQSKELIVPSYFRELIQNSWSLVSQPSIKNFSLQCSRLLKGASVADRIEIAGVPCFVISRHPCPELAAAIQRYHRKDRRRLSTQLSTIDESEESRPSLLESTVPKKLFAGANENFRQQDVIFHLTGGGFFAHMIAFDLLYLLDWSASTGAVVICPEFVLLPEHTFPDALQEVTNVYSSLVNGDAITTLGFEVSNIAVTGESTGGNLATALCVKLCLDADNNSIPEQNAVSTPMEDLSMASPQSWLDPENEYPQSSGSGTSEEQEQEAPWRDSEPRLPDALMLSCAVLNLSLELSHSRVLGTEDPVLPSGVISAISDAYLPPSLGISKKHMLASPFFASDQILARFPPTLLFASSNDPLLDDSVAFNQRLRNNGVEAELRAVQNMPHAYWGLGTAGFPEAKQVQAECCEWLATQLAKKHTI